ncbi:MAG: hypothetical protein CUN52_03200 [Phototrophicales bacterium]|nr:MAG: hypothetical protein CUN52_03200 [Phototrophicales bacterium]
MYKMLGVLLMFIGVFGVPATAQVVPQMDDEFVSTMQTIIQTANDKYVIPGSAVAFFQNGDIVYSGGFGVRNLETGDPITPETLFRPGSTLKSATAMLIATMVDDGLLTWDTPVSELLPNLRFPTDELTAELTIGEIMGHGTGLDSAVLPCYWDTLTVDDIIAAQANAPIIGERGASFRYNNDLFAIAGYAAVAASGIEGDYLTVYKQLMQERVFDPIGMTTFAISDDPDTFGDNVSATYTLNLILGVDVPYPIPYMPINTMAPAGGGVGSVLDMAKYLITQLNGGIAPNGTRVVSEANLLRTHQPQNFVDAGVANMDFVTYKGYGMGWITLDVGGVEVLWHNGGIDGFVTDMLIIPQANAGMVIMSNNLVSIFTNTWIMYEFVNQLYDLGIDTIEAQTDAIIAEQTKALAQLDPFLANPTPNLDRVAPLLGEYEKDWQVYINDDGLLILERHRLSFILLPLPIPNVFIVVSGQPGSQVTFKFDGDVPVLTFEAPTFTETVRKVA